MLKKNNRKFKYIVSIILAICMMTTFIPAAFAAQVNEYTDPVDNWLSSNNRTNELDVNATTTYETQICVVCDKYTTALVYRVPEYTKTGETALNRGVKYSDGTCIDGESIGNLDNGTPGIDAYFAGYHWTKSVCQTCGTINSVYGFADYGFNNNVYSLNSCDHNFFLDFDSSTYEPYSKDYHLTTLKRGEYCKFCRGTFARATQGLAEHNFTESVDAQLGNNRFFIAETCEVCGYETSEYVIAKSVITSYYGTADGEAHTLTVSDLSDSGVKTSIRYGDSADSCTKTSAPNYTQAGYYTVYYQINYTYAGETMTENGVSYVWLVADDEENNSNGTIVVLPTAHTHEFHYLETVKPSCEELGYERFQCLTCGELDKRNYTPATGHDYDDVVIREATCKQGGLILTLCADCGDFYQTTTATGEHKYTTVKHNPTCKGVGYTDHICEVCGDNYITDITSLVSHAYERITKEPTCEDKGYTTSTCTMCGYNYVDNYTEALGHDWDEGRTVTSSTCDAEGVIEHSCNNCDETMIKATSANGHNAGADATCTTPQLCEDCGTVLENTKGHSYESNVVEATCKAAGFTENTCSSCGHSYTSDFTDVAEHEYEKNVVEESCSQHGFTHYSCNNCDFEFDSDYAEKKAHDYIETVVQPSCSKMGYSEFNCANCDSYYIANYTDMQEHKYSETIIEPSCTTLGYTIYTCECGDTYKGEYKEPLGHTPSAWIVDVPATIENAGSKHIECTVCGEIMQTAELPQLIGKDNSDEDGKAEIGAYSIILTDENGKPIFNSELTIDVNDNVSIKLTGGRLLDFAKPTTITAFYTETQLPKENLNIFIEDVNGNKATGMTNADGQLVVPNDKTNTGDDNGTIGKEENEVKETYVVTVTDKMNVVIPNCDVYIGESNNVVVDLPDGIKPTRENPVIITITDQNGNPQADVTVIALGEADYIEKGKTDIYGKLTLPTASDGYTDEDGKVNVDELNVIVNDELGVIPNAYVQHNEDGTITVTLPDEKTISYANRITVTVLDSIGAAVKDKSVTVKDIAEMTYTALTDENGKATVPPTNIDYTDINGYAEVSGYIVTVVNESGAIEKAFITYNAEVKNEDGTVKAPTNISVVLPENVLFDYANRIIVSVLNKADNTPVKDMSVNVTETIAEVEESTETETPDNAEQTESTEQTEKTEPKTLNGVTDKNGVVVFPPLNEDITDNDGNSGIEETTPSEDTEDKTVKYNVSVADTKGNISNAFIKIEDGKVYITLPETHTLTTSNQTTATVTNENGEAVKGVSVTIADKTTSKTGTTDANGKVTLPVKSSGGGSSSGGSSRPSSSGGGGGGGSYASTTVKIVDKDEKTVSVTKSVTTTKATLTLPTGKNLLEDDNYYTITVTSGSKAKADYTVVLKDRKGNEVTGTTDDEGKLTLPGKEHKAYIFGYDDGTFRADNDMSRAEAAAIFARLIAEEKGESISGKSTFADVASNAWYASYIAYLEKYDIIKGYTDGTFRPNDAVTRAEFVAMAVRYYDLFNDVSKGNYTVNYTDLEKSYWAYADIAYAKHIGWLNGYADGTFKGDNNITRAEVVTVTNKATNRVPDEDYINKNVSTLNKFTDLKNNSHWAYYSIMEAANTHIGAVSKDAETWVK